MASGAICSTEWMEGGLLVLLVLLVLLQQRDWSRKNCSLQRRKLLPVVRCITWLFFFWFRLGDNKAGAGCAFGCSAVAGFVVVVVSSSQQHPNPAMRLLNEHLAGSLSSIVLSRSPAAGPRSPLFVASP